MTVSVVIPAHNAAATIADTLASVQAQSHADLEVVVVDDGSNDATAAIVSAHAGADPRVRLIRQRQGGVAAARNTGIAAARGDAIAFLDADDLWRPETVAALLSALSAGRPRVGLAYCWSAMIDEDGRIMPGKHCAGRHSGEVWRHLVAGNFIGNASAALVQRDSLEALCFTGQEGGQGAEDWRFYLEIAERWQFALVPRFLVGYRQRRGSMSRNLAPMIQSHRQVVAALLARHPELDPRPLHRAEAHLHLALASRAADHDAMGTVAGQVLAALCDDPALLGSPLFYRTLSLLPRCVASRLLDWSGRRPPQPERQLFLAGAELPARLRQPIQNPSQ